MVDSHGEHIPDLHFTTSHGIQECTRIGSPTRCRYFCEQCLFTALEERVTAWQYQTPVGAVFTGHPAGIRLSTTQFTNGNNVPSVQWQHDVVVCRSGVNSALPQRSNRFVSWSKERFLEYIELERLVLLFLQQLQHVFRDEKAATAIRPREKVSCCRV